MKNRIGSLGKDMDLGYVDFCKILQSLKLGQMLDIMDE